MNLSALNSITPKTLNFKVFNGKYEIFDEKKKSLGLDLKNNYLFLLDTESVNKITNFFYEKYEDVIYMEIWYTTSSSHESTPKIIAIRKNCMEETFNLLLKALPKKKRNSYIVDTNSYKHEDYFENLDIHHICKLK